MNPPGALHFPGLHAQRADGAARANPRPVPGCCESPIPNPQSRFSNPQKRTRPGNPRALFFGAQTEKPPGCTSLCNTGRSHILVGILPSPSILPLWVPRVPPSRQRTNPLARHPLLRSDFRCLNASPPVEQLPSLRLSWLGHLQPLPRSGRDSVRPSSIRFPSPVPVPRHS